MRRSKFRTACGVVAGIGFFIMLVAAGAAIPAPSTVRNRFAWRPWGSGYLPPDAIWEGISNEQG